MQKHQFHYFFHFSYIEVYEQIFRFRMNLSMRHESEDSFYYGIILGKAFTLINTQTCFVGNNFPTNFNSLYSTEEKEWHLI